MVRVFDESAVLLHRIRSEFCEMPGLRLTIAQAARLWQLDSRRSQECLDALVLDGLLRRGADGAYQMSSDLSVTRPPRN